VDSDIFGSREPAASRAAPVVKTVFPGSAGDAVKAAPRGDHGRSIHDAKIDLGGGYGRAENNYMRPSAVSRHSVQDHDVSAGTREKDGLKKQTDSHNIFGGDSQNALREINHPSVPSSNAYVCPPLRPRKAHVLSSWPGLPSASSARRELTTWRGLAHVGKTPWRPTRATRAHLSRLIRYEPQCSPRRAHRPRCSSYSSASDTDRI
jgi:hypothetical protein